MTDPHDPREFAQWEKRAPDGTVLATMQMVVGTAPVSPDEHGNVYVEVAR